MSNIQIHSIRTMPKICVRPYVKPKELERIKQETTDQLWREVNDRQYEQKQQQESYLRLNGNAGSTGARGDVRQLAIEHDAKPWLYRGLLRANSKRVGAFRGKWIKQYALPFALVFGAVYFGCFIYNLSVALTNG